MLEVTKVTYDGVEYLRLYVRTLSPELVGIITSIEGWFNDREPMVYGLPFYKAEELKYKTVNEMVVWKGEEDSMGSLVKGIDTSDISEEYCIPFTPKTPLRPHQVQAFNLLMSRDKMVISDQEGVGKTPPILCSHEAKIQYGLIKWGLYVTKAALTYDVLNQAKVFTNLRVKVISGTQKQRAQMYADLENTDCCDLVVVSYELFRQDIQQFIQFNKSKPFDVMYGDEFHKVKSLESQAGKLIHAIESRQRYAITATPIINEIIDMYNLLAWLGITTLNFFQFRNKYCDLNGYGKVEKYKNVGEVKVMLQANMLRRLKQDVLKDLPPVVNKYIYCEMTPAQRKLYKQIESGDFEGIDFDDLDFDDIPTQLSSFARLSQIAESVEIVGGEKGKKGSGKLAELETLLEEIVSRGEKAVIFSRSKRFIHIMQNYFKKYNPAIMTGDVSSQARKNQEVSDRQAQVDKFQNDESCKIILCCEAAAREGWTGTSGNHVIFTSKPWSPAYLSQCIGRCWRYGAQVHQSITVWSLISKDTIDEKVEELLGDKQFTINAMVETPMSTGEILNILGGKAS
ncbi:putative helicase [Brevibacillus phage SecTim467]|uniref:Putative helicase n=2 Tax=Jenstvirus jenst TaxID=1982225 RepID=A0A0K2CPJ4_9CAUD|nr:putative helicase [Brevibacillus phage Jenst]ALA07285.1 putative helicase [Brevibacillus phage Jenst]ALA07484.1 putative helicase [Brevibacillus phage SecTim467]